jgi:hypothetical protein
VINELSVSWLWWIVAYSNDVSPQKVNYQDSEVMKSSSACA